MARLNPRFRVPWAPKLLLMADFSRAHWREGAAVGGFTLIERLILRLTCLVTPPAFHFARWLWWFQRKRYKWEATRGR